MKVKITTVEDDMSEGWSVTLDVTPEMRVRDLKDLLTVEPYFLIFSKATKILARQASGMMYTLDDKAKVKKDMVLKGVGFPEKRATSPAKDAKAGAAAKPAAPKIAPAPPKNPAEAMLNAGRPTSREPPAIPTPAAPPAPERIPPSPTRRRQQEAPSPKPQASAPTSPSAKAKATAQTSSPVRSKATVASVQTSSPAISRPSAAQQDPFQLWLTSLQPVWPNYFGTRSEREPVRLKTVPISSAKQLAREVTEALSSDVIQTPLTAVFYHWLGAEDGPMSPGISRLPRLLEAEMLMADLVAKRLRPVAAKFGFSDDYSGVVDLFKALDEHVTHAHDMDKEFSDMLGRIMATVYWGNMDQSLGKRDQVMQWRNLSKLRNTALPSALFLSYAYHVVLPCMERRQRSAPRALAFAEVLLRDSQGGSTQWSIRRAAAMNRQVDSNVLVGTKTQIWVIGATDRYEGELARAGYFEDAAGLLWGPPGDSSTRIELVMMGDDLKPFGTLGTRVTVRVHGHIDMFGLPSKQPDMIVQFHSGIGTLDPTLLERWLSWMARVKDYNAPVVLTCRCETEAHAESALLKRLGFKVAVEHCRNLYSGMSGDPNITHDDNGWLVVIRGTSMTAEELRNVDVEEVCESVAQVVKAAEADGREASSPTNREQTSSPATSRTASPVRGVSPQRKATGVKEEEEGEESPASRSKAAAVFWGILDLKYDPDLKIGERVKVLETGDGRASRFSGYGAAILDTFKTDNKLQETVNRAVLVENKKMTHDFFFKAGYGHVLPKQVVYPKKYTKDLAKNISRDLNLTPGRICVLKLCNRARGAGCIPIGQEDLDEALLRLLEPPENMEAWLGKADKMFSRKVSWGCFEEQLRHWWSNECPCFIAEEFCQSRPIVKHDMEFDGTMRVGFSLHRAMNEVEEESIMITENGPVGTGKYDITKKLPEDAEEREDFLKNVITTAFWNMDSHTWKGMAKRDTLNIQWLGGYWKLPEEDIYSTDLRARIISKARQGTAPVDPTALHEVYSAFGDAVQQIFTLQEISPNQLVRRYNDFPEFGAFVAARVACSMRIRDIGKSKTVMGLAEAVNRKSKGGPAKDAVDSYILRNQGVYEVQAGKWAEADKLFEKSITVMPANATSRFLHGMYLLEAQAWARAVEAFEESLQLDPDFKAPYVNCGYSWLKLGRWDRAIEVCEAGLYRHPQTPQGFYNIGIACYSLAVEDKSLSPRPDDKSGGNLSWRDRAKEAFVNCRRHLDRKSTMWKEEDDDMVANLNSPMRRLPPLANPNGWKFYNWRP
mmetsp:Transcript_57199/g.100099  ORF Transcript_57199/g.100099 Transcript_57199/m.100099 type:complete len:1285 (-) Transcript_57199:113-3967(-)